MAFSVDTTGLNVASACRSACCRRFATVYWAFGWHAGVNRQSEGGIWQRILSQQFSPIIFGVHIDLTAGEVDESHVVGAKEQDRLGSRISP